MIDWPNSLAIAILVVSLGGLCLVFYALTSRYGTKAIVESPPPVIERDQITPETIGALPLWWYLDSDGELILITSASALSSSPGYPPSKGIDEADAQA